MNNLGMVWPVVVLTGMLAIAVAAVGIAAPASNSGLIITSIMGFAVPAVASLLVLLKATTTEKVVIETKDEVKEMKRDTIETKGEMKTIKEDLKETKKGTEEIHGLVNGNNTKLMERIDVLEKMLFDSKADKDVSVAKVAPEDGSVTGSLKGVLSVDEQKVPIEIDAKHLEKKS